MKVPILILLGCLTMLPLVARAQVGIGNASPAPSAALDIASTTKGILIPRLTQLQRIAIQAPATGLLIFQSDADVGFFYFDGSAWNKFAVNTSKSSTNETLLYTTQGF